jgi:hypothetical protein
VFIKKSRYLKEEQEIWNHRMVVGRGGDSSRGWVGVEEELGLEMDGSMIW